MEKLTDAFAVTESPQFKAWRDGLADYAADTLGHKAGSMVLNAEDDELFPFFMDGIPRVAVVARLVLSRLDTRESPLPPVGLYGLLPLSPELAIPVPRHIGLRRRALRILRGMVELFF